MNSIPRGRSDPLGALVTLATFLAFTAAGVFLVSLLPGDVMAALRSIESGTSGLAFSAIAVLFLLFLIGVAAAYMVYGPGYYGGRCR